MKTIIAAAAITTLSAVSAFAADLPARTYTKAPVFVAPVYSWTGLYLGIHGGGLDARGNGIVDPLPSPAALNRAGDVFDLNRSGGLAGVHAGYNFAITPMWVLGVEADWSWADAKASATAPIRNPAGVPFASGITTQARDLNWLASFRGRLGVTFDRVMIYGTGGFALGSSKFTGFTTDAPLPATIVWGTDFRSTRSGYVVGGGLEWAFAQNWILRGEFLHYHLNGTSVTADGVPAAPPFQIRYMWGDQRINAGRVGVSYKF